MINRWHQLNERERWILVLGGLFVAGYLFYAAIYHPLTQAITQKSQLLQEKKETLLWMKTVKSQYKKGHKPQDIQNAQLLSLLSQELKKPSFQPFPHQLQQVGGGDIMLTFEAVPFNLFMNWLWTLNQHYAFTLKQLQSDRLETEGLSKIILIVTANP